MNSYIQCHEKIGLQEPRNKANEKVVTEYNFEISTNLNVCFFDYQFEFYTLIFTPQGEFI